MKMKKKGTVLTGIMLLVIGLIVAGAVVLYRNGHQNEFTGSRVKNPDAYLLEITKMNGEDRHTMELRKSDTLHVDFVTEKGSIKLEIKAPDGAVLYSGNGTEVTEFTVTAPSDGGYLISVTAQRAKGTLRIRKE